MSTKEYVYVYEGTYTPIPKDVYDKMQATLTAKDIVYDTFEQMQLTKKESE